MATAKRRRSLGAQVGAPPKLNPRVRSRALPAHIKATCPLRAFLFEFPVSCERAAQQNNTMSSAAAAATGVTVSRKLLAMFFIVAIPLLYKYKYLVVCE